MQSPARACAVIRSTLAPIKARSCAAMSCMRFTASGHNLAFAQNPVLQTAKHLISVKIQFGHIHGWSLHKYFQDVDTGAFANHYSIKTAREVRGQAVLLLFRSFRLVHQKTPCTLWISFQQKLYSEEHTYDKCMISAPQPEAVEAGQMQSRWERSRCSNRCSDCRQLLIHKCAV